MSFTRAVVFVGLAWAAGVVTSALVALSPWRLPVPEVALLLVLHLGIRSRGPLPSHVGVALVIGWLADLFSGAPTGLHALSLAVMMTLARGASSRLLVSSLWQEVLVALLAALGHGGLVLAASAPMYEGEAFAALRLVPGAALATALASPLVFAVLRRIDRRLLQPSTALRLGA